MSKAPKSVPNHCLEVYIDAISTDDLVGKILTIIDASVPPGTQCEALKTIIKKEIWSWATRAQYAMPSTKMDEIVKSAERAPRDAKFPLETYRA